MTTYKEYQDQIAKLQILAKQARQVEMTEACRKVRDLMEKHGLKPKDFAEMKKEVKSPSKASTVPAKYREPESGDTWNGRGRSPLWLKGVNKDDFLIE